LWLIARATAGGNEALVHFLYQLNSTRAVAEAKMPLSLSLSREDLGARISPPWKTGRANSEYVAANRVTRHGWTIPPKPAA
jgi:hypothetical protein